MLLDRLKGDADYYTMKRRDVQRTDKVGGLEPANLARSQYLLK